MGVLLQQGAGYQVPLQGRVDLVRKRDVEAETVGSAPLRPMAEGAGWGGGIQERAHSENFSVKESVLHFAELGKASWARFCHHWGRT